MSGRKLGGGRILGNGKGLAPPTPPSAPRATSPFAPSESTASLASLSPPASGSLPELGHDIGASISVGAQGQRATRDGSGLVCPICDEEMVTLLQLNRHIDDVHQELPEEEQHEVKTWFDKQVLKAKRFQPLSLINKKLRGLEVFESNAHIPSPQLPPSGSSGSVRAAVSDNNNPNFDPDQLITRAHWQRSTAHDRCTDPTCGQSLGPLNGSINCRKCGRLFCEEHTMYQMKLSRSANHEPVRGFWARVCETCYKSREGYNDHTGLSVDHMATFAEIRNKRVERQKLESARLEKRLTKLTRLLADMPDASIASPGASLLAPVSSLMMGHREARKLLEQSVAPWEDDEAVSRCPFCQQEFGAWTFRRQHCRICGRVVCADVQTACSTAVSLDVAKSAPSTPSEKKPTTTAMTNGSSGLHNNNGDDNDDGDGPPLRVISVRMCRDCNHIIFSHRDFAASLQHRTPDQRAYETLCQFERGIRLLLPSFQRALLALQQQQTQPHQPTSGGAAVPPTSRPPPTHAQIQEAAKLRRRLIDSFGKYGAAAKRLRALPTSSPTQKRLQEAVYTYASGFLHAHMLPLKSLPQLLRAATASSSSSSSQQYNHHHSHHAHHSSSASSSSAASSGAGIAARFLAGPSRSTSSLRHSELAAPLSSTSTSSTTTTNTDPNRNNNRNNNHMNDNGYAQDEEAASSTISTLEAEERDVRERLVILQEQRLMVRNMMGSATGARRFEEVGALARNLDELDEEIKGLAARVGDVERRWEGLYAGGHGEGRR